MLGRIDEPTPEILLTIALVTGGFALAKARVVSGPLAIVVAGLMIGNHGREFAMSARTRQQLDTFWAVADEVLNSALFLLIGLDLLAVSMTPALWRGPLGPLHHPDAHLGRAARGHRHRARIEPSRSGRHGRRCSP